MEPGLDLAMQWKAKQSGEFLTRNQEMIVPYGFPRQKRSLAIVKLLLHL